MAAQARMIIEDAQQKGDAPLARGQKHPPRAVMKIQMPEPVDVRVLEGTNLAGLEPSLGRLAARTMHGTAPGTFDEAVAFHEAHDRGIRRFRRQGGILLDQSRQVIGVQLVAPTGMLPVLLGQLRYQGGAQGRMLALVGADLALEHFDRTRLGGGRLLVPSLEGGEPQREPVASDGMAPLFIGQGLELRLQLAPRRGRRQKRSDHAEAKMRPALGRPKGGLVFFHRMPVRSFFSPLRWRWWASIHPSVSGHLASSAGVTSSLNHLAAQAPRPWSADEGIAAN